MGSAGQWYNEELDPGFLEEVLFKLRFHGATLGRAELWQRRQNSPARKCTENALRRDKIERPSTPGRGWQEGQPMVLELWGRA